MLRNKSNLAAKRPILWKLIRHCRKKLKMAQTNGKIHHTHGLEELIQIVPYI